MKKTGLFYLSIALFIPSLCKAQAIQLDPGLVAVIEEQTLVLQDVYKKRNETQNKLIAAQGAVTTAMEVVHGVEKTILDYMKNASSAMDNIYQLTRAAKLIKDIPDNLLTMAKAVPANYEGTAVSALTTRTATDVIAEMSSLYGFMSQLVTSTSFSFKDKETTEEVSSDKKNVNLLSAAERYYIANEVVSKLESLNRKINYITWQIKNLGWEDGWRNIDPTSWYQSNRGKQIADQLINQWKNAKF